MRKIARALRNYSVRDLAPYALSLLLDQVLKSHSVLMFRLKCYWHGVGCDGVPKIWGNFYFRRFPGSQIKIGSNFYAVCKPGRYAFNIFPQSAIRTYSSGARIIIGENVGLNSIAIFCRSKTISIGSGCLIGGNCQVTDNDGHATWPATGRLLSPGLEFDQDVTIGDNVFIGLNVTILKGVSIGNNSVIAAGSIVASSIPSDCLAGGVPAKVIKFYSDTPDGKVQNLS